MTTIEIIRGALARRSDPTAPGVATDAWWAALAAEIKAEGDALVKVRRLAQFAARFTGQAILVDAQSSNGREIASFELRMQDDTRTLACLALNEVAMRQM